MDNELHPDIVKFTAETYDEDGNKTTSSHQMFVTEGDLHDYLYHFKSFLQGAGFNYVDNVYAVKSDGKEVGEE